jgi:DNA-binding MarR family transcriptional regulator/GNAT superfamily N-acetyltransferase
MTKDCDLYNLAGPAALGTRLRKLADMLAADAEQLYQHYQVNIDPRWFPHLFMLGKHDSMTVSELAASIGQSHASVSQVAKRMSQAELVASKPCEDDGRASRLTLTSTGREAAEKLDIQVNDVNTPVTRLFADAGVNLWQALAAIDHALDEQTLLSRVKATQRKRIAENIEIKPFAPEHAADFKALNKKWITEHFSLEEADRKTLDDPYGYVIEPGGYIAVAIWQGKVVGTCALIKQANDEYELAKMAVTDRCKSTGVGFLLGQHMIETARDLGAKSIYLESNSKLKPALNLYRKLGFKPSVGKSSPYCRCDVQMEMAL